MIEVMYSFPDSGLTGEDIGIGDTVAEGIVVTEFSREGDAFVETERPIDPRTTDECAVGFAVGWAWIKQEHADEMRDAGAAAGT